jgi:hypothetical protein
MFSVGSLEVHANLETCSTAKVEMLSFTILACLCFLSGFYHVQSSLLSSTFQILSP